MTGPRPAHLVVCLGTATEVGKTWVGAATLGHLRAARLRVAARKPLQSFDPTDPNPTDAAALGAATGEPEAVVCPPSGAYPVALAPPMAAEALSRPCPTVAALVRGLSWPEPAVDLGWVEGVGGPRSPMAADGDGVDLVSAVRPDTVVLVAHAGLGTLNDVRLAAPLLAPLAAVVVHLNRFDPGDDLHRANLDWLRTREGLEAVTSPEALASLLSSR